MPPTLGVRSHRVLKTPQRPIACPEPRSRERLSQPGAFQLLSSKFCPIERGRRSHTEQSWQGRRGTSNSFPLSETSNPTLRPFRGLASGTCHQVFSTNSREYQTPFLRDQKAEIFLEYKKNPQKLHLEARRYSLKWPTEDISFRKKQEPAVMQNRDGSTVDRGEGRGAHTDNWFPGRLFSVEVQHGPAD